MFKLFYKIGHETMGLSYKEIYVGWIWGVIILTVSSAIEEIALWDDGFAFAGRCSSRLQMTSWDGNPVVNSTAVTHLD